MRRALAAGLLIALAAFGIFAALHWWIAPWIWHPLGTCTGANCKGYQFWSGLASDISEITLPVGLAVFYLHHTCANPRCFRWGKHPTADGLHKLCRHCHPDLPDKRPTLSEIHARHEQARLPDLRAIHQRQAELLEQGERAMVDLRETVERLERRAR